MIRHAYDCQGGETETFVGTRGDTLEKCRTCGMFAVVAEAAVPPPRPARSGIDFIPPAPETVRTGAQWPRHKYRDRRQRRARRRRNPQEVGA